MKRTAQLFAVAAAILLAASAALAQHEHHGAAQHKVATGVKLDVKDDAAAQTFTVRVGPFHLSVNSDHNATPQAPDAYLTIPFDGWLIAYHPRVVDGAGQPVPNKVLHHVAFWNIARPDFLCPNKEEHIFGAGGEMNDWPALPGFGYRVRKGDRIRVNTMWHNPTGTHYPMAYLEVRMEYRRAAPGVALKSVYPTWLDVMRCGDSGYDLKPGKNITSGEFTLGFTGALLGLGGHLHDYGERLDVRNSTKNEVIAALQSKLDAAGRILAMPIVTFVERGGYRLNKGEIVRVTATYDNRTARPLPEGAMGIAVGYFLPDDDALVAALKRNKPASAKKSR
ncbi:MAG: hypothetical protein HY234_11125 [Acidobacteria bacterium]|nr:hypothetical protein [Acidobacteriota bacterium]